jgi:D-amino-acid oxidase
VAGPAEPASYGQTVANIDADAVVVGAGVIGLTTAICLAEAGLAVALAAAEPPAQTTSIAAGAIWGPHLVGMDNRVERWAGVTLDRLAALSHPDLGASELAGIVRTASGVAASRERSPVPPEVAARSSDLAPCLPGQIPVGYESAWRLTATIVSMPGYLEYLSRRYSRAGGLSTFGVKLATLADAAQLAPSAQVIVNCTGCGARDLVPDPDVTPVRGQVVVTANPGLTEFFVGTGSDPGDLTYLFPHGDVVVLGGTEQPGNWSLEPDPATAAQIVAACAAIEPSLRTAPVLEHRVGLRPTRTCVRLEAVHHKTVHPTNGRDREVTIVHNYGHGGAGVTLSWGCAEDAAELVLAELG